MINWTLQTISIKQLKANPKNPRQISKEQVQHLEELIKKYGMIDKLVVNADMMVVGGHQRLKILKKLKIKEVECWVPDRLLDKDELDHLCVGLNLNQGKWDYDILANEYEMIDLLKWGFSEDQLVGDCKDAEEKISEIGKEAEEKSSKKTKNCPNCGHEL